jgi:hypothetical protein
MLTQLAAVAAVITAFLWIEEAAVRRSATANEHRVLSRSFERLLVRVDRADNLREPHRSNAVREFGAVCEDLAERWSRSAVVPGSKPLFREFGGRQVLTLADSEGVR